jgi:hypothetical protein
LINNRQNGRRRGRGGGPRSPNQGPNPGNRQDNRSRGNAAQLLEKYKALARDAQMAGDRVQTEYWLQFADHYFRVLNESRARFEEQRPRRDDYSDEDEGDESGINVAVDAEERDVRDDREEREDRGERQDRGYRDRGDRVERVERPRREYGADRNGEPRPERRPRDDRHDRDDEAAESGERISLEVLPPAISVVEIDAPPKPARRRTRRPRDEDGEEIAPAA